ncbi:MAG: 4Fe-4S binding protein, partial [Chloroflexi bacterium]|nr:4Fe-4S binding protein [Chloroflexota bacterium]
DAWDRKEVVNVIRRAVSFKGPAVVIARGPCQQIPEIKRSHRIPFYVIEDMCTQCDACFKVWCPAITRTENNFPVIAANECTSCTVCAQVCPTDAIKLAEEHA